MLNMLTPNLAYTTLVVIILIQLNYIYTQNGTGTRWQGQVVVDIIK